MFFEAALALILTRSGGLHRPVLPTIATTLGGPIGLIMFEVVIQPS